MSKKIISEKAVWSRVNRQLAKSGEVLRKSRGGWAAVDFGRWYIINIYHNAIIDRHIDLELLARDMGVIGGHETLGHD